MMNLDVAGWKPGEIPETLFQRVPVVTKVRGKLKLIRENTKQLLLAADAGRDVGDEGIGCVATHG